MRKGPGVRILVAGSGGFIGKALRTEAEARGHTVIPYDQPRDVCDRDGLLAAMTGTRAEAVINLAGVLGTEEIFGSEANAAAVNIIGAINVYDAALSVGIPVVQIGTGHKGQPNPYAITKACAEDLGLARARYGTDRIVIVRAYHAYGPGQKACPPHGPGAVRKIVPSMVCRALTGMPVQVNGDGDQLIDLVHVEDVAAALVDGLAAAPGSVIEAGTGKPTSVIDAAWTIIDRCRSESQVEHVAPRRGEPEHARVVAETPACPHPWPWGLDSTIGYYRRILA